MHGSFCCKEGSYYFSGTASPSPDSQSLERIWRSRRSGATGQVLVQRNLGPSRVYMGQQGIRIVGDPG